MRALHFLIVSALLAGGAGRLAWLEQNRGEELRRRAAGQHTATTPIPAQRGEILDTKGRVLAGSVRRPSIYADPSQIENPRFAAYSIAPVLRLEPSALEQELVEKAERGFAWVKRGVSEDELARFSALRAGRHLRAFAVRYEPVRDYPQGALAAHIIGFVGAEQNGLAGIEQAFNEEMTGRDGRRSAIVDVLRRRVETLPDEYVAPHMGASVVLTIDAHIQERTQEHLRTAVEQFKAEWGAAVVMDPQTGEVLAMAVVPDFDPREPIAPGLAGAALAAAQEKLRNRSVSDSYEPGSIFKPFIASIALDEQRVRMDEIFAVNGPARQFGSRTIHDTHTYGSLALHEVISKSSNIGMALLGSRLGNERLCRYVRSYGFGDATGIELPGEHTGLVQDFSRWGPFSTQSIPIGQEIALTPIQIATAFSVFCNGGVLYRPRIVRGVISSDGETLSDTSEPIAIRRVLEPSTALLFRRQALVETVTDGTGKSAAIPDWQVFGKTGTAQIARPGGRGYIPGKYIGSFVGGAPSDDPRVVALVSLYKPSSGKYYGGTVAAPAVGAILADVLAYMHVPPERMPERSKPRAAKELDD
ncbi:Peptidoglycan D,D-transpeptidase FtsI [Phycisphaerae bacterium RAS1]|nr:Peptidoglycan D,D-transpeptidase FtsI [Phycisphaerae bacterium RAS1]